MSKNLLVSYSKDAKRFCIRLVWEEDNRRIVDRNTKLILILCFYFSRPKNTQIRISDIVNKLKLSAKTKTPH